MSKGKSRAVSDNEFVVLMAVCMSIVALSIDAMLPALGIIGQDLNASYLNQPQLIISFIFIGMALGQLICGPLSDALGRKKLLISSLAFYLIGTSVCLLTNSMPMMLFGRFLQGLGVAGPYVSTVSIVRDCYSGAAMAKIMSLIMMIFIMVPVIAPTLGQGILYLGSWRLIFILFLVYALAIIVWSSIRLDETLPREERIPFSLHNIYKGINVVIGHKATRYYMLCSGCIFGALIGYLNSCLQIFQEIFGVGESFAFYFGGLAFTFGFSSLLNSKFVERLGMREISMLALAAMLTATVIYAATQSVTGPILWMFVLFMALQFFCLGLVFGNINALAMEPMGHIAGIASAIIGFTSSVVSISLGTVIGQYYDGSLIPILCGVGVSSSLALLFFILAKPSSTEATAKPIES